MQKVRLSISFLALLICGSSQLYGQMKHHSLILVDDLQEFVESPAYSVEEGQRYNHPSFYTHPDFGKLTFTAPEGKNVVEDISKRTAYERYYIDLDDPTFFYIHKTSNQQNIFSGGVWRAIDPSLHVAGKGFYTSGFQPYPTELDTDMGLTRISTPEGFVSFNNYKLKRIYMDDSADTLSANWSDVSVDNFECYVTDIFPGIDLKIKFSERSVKGDFIIKQDLGLKSLIFIDQMDLPDHFEPLIDNTSDLDLEYVEIYDTQTAENVIVIDPARSHDNSVSKESWFCKYELEDHNLLIICDSNQLNNSSLVYPLTIDPTFVAVGPITSGFPVSGSLIYPAACTDIINVTFPGGSTPWDADVSATIFADFCAITAFFPPVIDCWASEQGFWVTSGCGGISPATAPGTTWGCTIPACDAPGGWVLSSGFNTSGTQSLVQCYPASCANIPMVFTMNFTRAWCPVYTIYDDCVWANSYCESLDDWGITIQGKSVETLGNTATGNGSQNIYDADCAGTQTLNPTPLYGVGPYTYAWSTGGSGATEVVPGSVGTYTVDVTDLCGTTVTATFDIGCPLSVDLSAFTARKINDDVLLEWVTSNEVGTEHFEIEQSVDGESWRNIGSRASLGDAETEQHYSLMDEHPAIGTNYYRILQYLSDGSFEYSDIIQMEFRNEFSIYPNPASSSVNLVLTSDQLLGGLSFEISDLYGRVILQEVIDAKSQLVSLDNVQAGNYIIQLMRNGEMIEYKRLTVK